MTELLLSWVPDYGLYIVGLTIFLAAIGIPLPSSVVMLTSGGLAGTGDLSLYQLLLTGVVAFILGDQLAYSIGAKSGPGWLERMKKKSKISGLVCKAEQLYSKHGIFAVLLSRTVLSPSGPCIAYLSGASKMEHKQFSVVAAIGALIWTNVYGLLGFMFAGHVPAISDVVIGVLAVSIALIFTIGFGLWLAFAWQRFEAIPAD